MQLNLEEWSQHLITFLANVYLKIIAFLRKFFTLTRLVQLEAALIDWLDNREEEHCNTMTGAGDNLFKFRPFELRKLNYRLAHDGNFPKQRSGHRLVCSDHCLYLFGGYNPNNGNNETPLSCLFKELWKFDLITQQWTLLMGNENTSMPLELASHAMIMHGDYIMIFGGTSYPFGIDMSNKLYISRITEPMGQMEEIDATGDLPPTGYGQAIAVHNNYMYAVGGTDGFGYTCDVHRLDVRTKQWEYLYMCRRDIRDDPEPRYRHELAYNGRYLYVIGGGTADIAFSLQRIPAFDLEANVWCYFDTKPDPKLNNGFPMNRKCHSCVQHGNSVIIVGGNDGRKSFKDIWRLNLETYQWSCFMNGASIFPTPLFFHDAAVTSAHVCGYSPRLRS